MFTFLKSDVDGAGQVSAGLVHAPVLLLDHVAGRAVLRGFLMLFLGQRATGACPFHSDSRKA